MRFRYSFVVLVLALFSLEWATEASAQLAATVAHLEGMGVTKDSAPRSLGNLTIAFLTDPNGTYIELTLGLGQ